MLKLLSHLVYRGADLKVAVAVAGEFGGLAMADRQWRTAVGRADRGKV